MDLRKFVRDIPDFPQKGVLFRDITPLLKDEKAFEFAVKEMSKPFKEEKIDIVVGIEARGLILAAPIAFYIGAGFVPIRKPGKLPWKTQRKEYELEYGMAILEIHEDAINKNDRVLIVDDVLATGGTAKAAADLVEQLGGEVLGFDFLIELIDFKAKEILKKYTLFSLLKL
ncbi:MAG TPA: adenine phosphoribosyltransferase [Caldisericia bacterium]|nr:adenine phosphoribosyltransferase [Caldisericia bacterium]HOK17654.1 adenine phosphoribosyltransferase [Caldisericia bacterium]HOL82899.1 adenine phosphoribosyltransferase [Caldisericia bacterium]HPB34395.1 adenine phosphoribosyltransferase [Caldisericia bacterium]HPP43024.1 adenine phosphoribosyltransferase [Caldisericia bacterium]